jgi:hypothetical protein
MRYDEPRLVWTSLPITHLLYSVVFYYFYSSLADNRALY